MLAAHFRVPDEPDKFAEWKKQNDEFILSFKAENRKEFLDRFLESQFVKEFSTELKAEIKAKVFSMPEHVANSVIEAMVRPENWTEYSLAVPTLVVYAVSPGILAGEYLKSLFPLLE